MIPKLRVMEGRKDATPPDPVPFLRRDPGFPYDEQGKRIRPFYEEGPVHLLQSMTGIAKNYPDHRMVYDTRLHRFEQYKNTYTEDAGWTFTQQEASRLDIVEFLADIHAVAQSDNAQVAQFLERHPELKLENFE